MATLQLALRHHSRVAQTAAGSDGCVVVVCLSQWGDRIGPRGAHHGPGGPRQLLSAQPLLRPAAEHWLWRHNLGSPHGQSVRAVLALPYADDAMLC